MTVMGGTGAVLELAGGGAGLFSRDESLRFCLFGS